MIFRSFQVLRGFALFLVAACWAVAAHLGSTGAGNPDINVAVCVAPVVFAVWMLFGRGARSLVVIGSLGLLALLVAAWPLLRERIALLYFLQQIGINLALASLFGRTLRGEGDALITQLARKIEGPDLSPHKIRYTRQVTIAWTLFFLINVAISTLLYGLAAPAVWSVYANLLGMPLIAAMFVGEHLWRMHVLPPEERPTMSEVVRAWRAHDQSSRS
jgi:uncharacterized membrane protein